jgi:tetratricopeptide (TPR) repeat protein
MTIKEAILKSLEDFNGLTNYLEAYKSNLLRVKISNSLVHLLFLLLLIFISCNPKNANESLNEGVKEFNDHQYRTAIKHFEECLKSEPNNRTAKLFIAKSHYGLEDYQNALITLTSLLNEDPKNYEGLVIRASIKYELNDFYGALNDCDSAKMVNKDFVPVYELKAKIYEKLSDNNNAIIQYGFIIQLGHVDKEVFYNLALLLLDKGQNEIACNYLRKAGELGFMKAFDLIKISCNSNPANGSFQLFQKAGIGIRHNCLFKEDKTFINLSNQQDSPKKIVGAYIGIENEGNVTTGVLNNIVVYDEYKMYDKQPSEKYKEISDYYLKQYSQHLASSNIDYLETTYMGVPALEYKFDQNGLPTNAIFFLKNKRSYLLQTGTRNELKKKFALLKDSFCIF